MVRDTVPNTSGYTRYEIRNLMSMLPKYVSASGRSISKLKQQHPRAAIVEIDV